jgi:hypothetical protein
MNKSQFTCRTSIAKRAFLFVAVILFFISCKKQSKNDEVTAPTNQEISFKADQWYVYPYIGGPGEDSAYFTMSPQLVANNSPAIKNQHIKKVSIKTKSGSFYTALYGDVQPIQVSRNDGGYSYQMGDGLNKPWNIGLWWTQKVPGQKPDADSVFISLY